MIGCPRIFKFSIIKCSLHERKTEPIGCSQYHRIVEEKGR